MLQHLVDEYKKMNAPPRKNHLRNHRRLCKLVDTYGAEATSIATGLALTTVNQHYSNKKGTGALIGSGRLVRAEMILASM